MACCYSIIIPSLNYSSIKSIEKKKEKKNVENRWMLAAGGKHPHPPTHKWFHCVFFSGRNTFIICPSKQRNRKYPSAWKWRYHLPSGSCFSLAGGGKRYVIRTFRTASNFRTVSDPLLLLQHVKKKKTTHIFHIWFFLFPLVQILHPSARPHVWMRLDMEMSNAADQ